MYSIQGLNGIPCRLQGLGAMYCLTNTCTSPINSHLPKPTGHGITSSFKYTFHVHIIPDSRGKQAKWNLSTAPCIILDSKSTRNAIEGEGEGNG
jgi:hypothetical protein